MAAALRHRGPDGFGFLRDRDCALVHTRLSLVDLQGGAQPIGNEDETLWIVGNGEIFDHASWRDELRARDHRFATASDMEVLLHAFEEWGDDVWARFDGQFAFALWDVAARELRLVRDRSGVLPIHYAKQSDAFVFASEAKALFAGGRVPADIDLGAMHEAFTLWSTLPPRTSFVDVHAVPPGTVLRLAADFSVHTERWWQEDFTPATAPPSLAAAADELGERLTTAVRRRLAADVPVGSYLSGGIDSAVLAALAMREQGQLQTFGVQFEDGAFDEGAEQRRVSDFLGTQHHDVRCSDADIRANFADVVWHCEAPLLRTAPVPLFLLSQLTQSRGIKAVLSGEGADELLGGYSVFLEDRVRRFWARQPESTMRPALFARVHDFVANEQQRSGAMWRAFFGQGLQDTDAPGYAHSIRWRNNAWTRRLLQADANAGKADYAQQVMASLHPRFAEWPALSRAQAMEFASFLSTYLLASQGDRVALAHGVEVRYPFLGRDVLDYASHLPQQCKLRGLQTKVVLREVARQLLPDDIVARPKRPYRAPMSGALFASGDDRVGELLTPSALASNPHLNAKGAGRLLERARTNPTLSEREGMALTGVLSLQLLRQQFVLDLETRLREPVERLRALCPDVDRDLAAAATPSRKP